MRGVRCIFSCTGLAKTPKGGRTLSKGVSWRSSGEFVNGAVLWSRVDQLDAAAFVLGRCFIFKPISERVPVSSVITGT